MKIPFVDGHYTAYSGQVAGEKCINWFPEFNRAGRGNRTEEDVKFTLRPTPGGLPFAGLGAAIRGMFRMVGLNYVVAGTTLYSVTDSGVVVAIGAIAGTQRCDIAKDGINLVIVNGTEGYFYNGSTLTEIVDEDFYPSSQVEFFDGLMVFKRSGTGQFFISDAYDPGSLDGLNFATAEGAPDLLRSIVNNGRLLYLFGGRSIEIWQPSGGTFYFSRINQAFIEKGCIAEFSTVKLDNTIYWLADDGIVYKIVGYEYSSVTPPGIADQISRAANPEDAYAFSYIEDGHAFYAITFSEFTLVYDVTTDKWHERASWNDITEKQERWKSSHYLKAGNMHLVGTEDGNVLQLDNETFTDNGDMVVRDRITTDMEDGDRLVRNPKFWIKFQSGVGLEDNSDPIAMLKTSDDGGETWSSEMWRSLGKKGEYKNRAIWRRLGAFRQRRYWLRVQSAVKAVVIDAGGVFK